MLREGWNIFAVEHGWSSVIKHRQLHRARFRTMVKTVRVTVRKVHVPKQLSLAWWFLNMTSKERMFERQVTIKQQANTTCHSLYWLLLSTFPFPVKCLRGISVTGVFAAVGSPDWCVGSSFGPNRSKDWPNAWWLQKLASHEHYSDHVNLFFILLYSDCLQAGHGRCLRQFSYYKVQTPLHSLCVTAVCSCSY
jgi:hypothetical protein